MIRSSAFAKVMVAGVALLTVCGSKSIIHANSTYKDTSIAGIDVAIDNYVADQAVEVEEASTEAPKPEVKYPQFENKVMAKVNDALNVRAEADENSERVGKLPKGAAAVVLEKGSDWTKIESGNCIGYVKNDFLVFGDEAGAYAEENCEKIATVETMTLRVREEDNVESTCLTTLPEGEKYEVISQDEEWSKILIDDDFAGYVSNDYITVEFVVTKAITVEEEIAEAKRLEELAAAQAAAEQQALEEQRRKEEAETPSNPTPSAPAPAPAPAPASGNVRADLVNYALQFQGAPYVYGGTNFSTGVDCSGFTYLVFQQFGVGLPRTSASQAGVGTPVGIYDVQPGDLLFYNNGGSSIQHVAIYIGNGQIIHASTPSTGVIVSNAYRQTPSCAVSVLN